MDTQEAIDCTQAGLEALRLRVIVADAVATLCPLPWIVAEFDVDSRLVVRDASESAVELFGGALRGVDVERLVPPELVERHRHGVATLSGCPGGQKGRTYVGEPREWPALRLDGSSVTVRQLVCCYDLGDGRCLYVAFYLREFDVA